MLRIETMWSERQKAVHKKEKSVKEEMRAKFTALQFRRNDLNKRSIDQVRLLEPALRDAGLNHQADRLLAVIVEWDALDRELTELINSDVNAAVELMIESVGRRGK
jgi:hypothetical protein